MQITKIDSLENAVKLIKEWPYEYIVLDTETTSLDPHVARVISFTISDPIGEYIYFIPGDYLSALASLTVPAVCHNFRYDFNVCYRNGVDLRIPGLKHDTMLLDHLINEENDHDLDSIVKRYFNDNYKEVFWSKYKDMTGRFTAEYEKSLLAKLVPIRVYEDKWVDEDGVEHQEEVPDIIDSERYQREKEELFRNSNTFEQDLIEYSSKDAGYTAKVFRIQIGLMYKTIPASLTQYVKQFALSLYDTELRGIRVDLPYLHDMGNSLDKQISEKLLQLRSQVNNECNQIEEAMYERELDKRKTNRGKAGVIRPTFNFNSTAQLGTLLYDSLKLPERRNKAGNRTVDDAALESLEQAHPIVPILRENRALVKVKTAFIDGTLENLVGSRIYPSFNVNGTVTGRISSSSPNMQQLPRDGGVRGIYIPDDGYVFLSYDYSQLEVTIAAHFSGDRNLLRIINEGVSQHDITASGLNIPRHLAKTINFALQYGAGAQKIQKILGGSLKDAEEALERYWTTYSGLSEFIKSVHKRIETGQPLINPFGRARHLPSKEDLSNKWGSQGFFSRKEDKFIYFRDIYWNGVLRQGPNSLIQGTGADITNTAFTRVDQQFKLLGIGYALFPIHDEVLVQVKEDSVDVAREIMEHEMVDVGRRINLTVPLKIDGGKPMKRWNK